MLGKIFSAVLCGLVPVKDGAGLGVLHHGSHQLGGMGKVGLGLPKLFRQRMKRETASSALAESWSYSVMFCSCMN